MAADAPAMPQREASTTLMLANVSARKLAKLTHTNKERIDNSWRKRHDSRKMSLRFRPRCAFTSKSKRQ